MNNRDKLAHFAEINARKPYHGKVMGMRSNIKEITSHFNGTDSEFEGKWCAAFVYHCCIQAGYKIPYRYPHEGFGSFAGVLAWLKWAKLPIHRFYHSRQSSFVPSRGDIIIFDRIFDPGPHDHIGIILKRMNDETIIVAEGNVHNISCVLEREINSHVRGFIRIPLNL